MMDEQIICLQESYTHVLALIALFTQIDKICLSGLGALP